MKLKQLSVLIENKAGTLAEVTGILKEGDINIRAISAFDTPQYGILRLILDQPEKGKELLHENGYNVTITEVIAVELEDRKGALNEVLKLMDAEKIEIEYIYSFVLQKENSPLMIIKVNDLTRAILVLGDNNIKLALQNDIQSI